ncbi:hypothetical protein BG006_003216, partial [Podila minutissima]
MTAANTGTAYAVDIVILQKLFFNDEKPFIAGLLLVLTTQITGFALAGALRKFLVHPAHMVWPGCLAYASLFRSLHHTDEEPKDANRMSRMSSPWNSKNYPILSPALYREIGIVYDKSEVLTGNVLGENKCLAYGPMRMDSFFALIYGVSFAGLTATIVHALLYNGKEM